MVERDQSFDDQGMMRTHRLSLFMSEQQHNTPRARPCHVSCSACDGPVGVSHLLLDSEASVHPVSGMLSSGAVELVETLGWFGLCQRLERTFRFERKPRFVLGWLCASSSSFPASVPVTFEVLVASTFVSACFLQVFFSRRDSL